MTDVTASYRTFLSYEHDLTELNDQFEKLKTIRTTFTRLKDGSVWATPGKPSWSWKR